MDLTVDLGSGAGPYNYGDMTGSATTAPPGQGSWTFVFDSGVIGKAWGLLDWIAETPSDSNVNVLVRKSTDGITFPSMFVQVTRLVVFDVPDGRYLQIRVLLFRASTGETPILRELFLYDLPQNETMV